MPKMKTKSSAKKRYARGTQVLSDPDQKLAKRYMPYDR